MSMTTLPASVAPMEGITTFPMRLWLSLASQPAAATTPFLRATKTFPERRLPVTYAPELFELRGVLPYTIKALGAGLYMRPASSLTLAQQPHNPG